MASASICFLLGRMELAGIRLVCGTQALTGRADTAIAATSAGSANLFDMDVHRILARPLKK
ncbi:MAG: hypothetical protein IMF16_01820 [Proteobacteria bacterium]|nr:hypothetical protein [Pseudomonadota bacterium]